MVGSCVQGSIIGGEYLERLSAYRDWLYSIDLVSHMIKHANICR